MTSGEITAIVAVIGSFLGFVGVSIDPTILQNGVAGLVSIIVLGSAIWTAFKHLQAVAEAKS